MTTSKITLIEGERKKRDYRLIYSIALCLFMFVLGNGKNTILSIVAIAAAAPLILSPQYLIAPLLFSTLMNLSLLAFNGQSFSRYYTLIFIASVALQVLMIRKRRYASVWVSIAAVAGALALVLSNWGAFGYTKLPIEFLLNLVLFVAILLVIVNNREAVEKQIWIAALLATAYSPIILLSSGIGVFEDGRVGVFEGDVNANSLAMALSVAFGIIFAHFCIKGFKHKILHIGLLGYLLVALFLTGSRSSLIAALVALVAVLAAWRKNKSLRIGKLLVASVVIIVGFVAVYDLLQEKFPTLMERFTISNVSESGGTHRIEVWEAYFNYYFADYAIFGMGFDPSNFYVGVRFVNGVGHGAHNLFVDILGSMGIVGLIFYIFVYGRAIIEMLSRIKRYTAILLPYAMLIATLAVGIGENVFRGRMVWMSIALAVTMFSSVLREKKEKKPIATGE